MEFVHILIKVIYINTQYIRDLPGKKVKKKIKKFVHF